MTTTPIPADVLTARNNMTTSIHAAIDGDGSHIVTMTLHGAGVEEAAELADTMEMHGWHYQAAELRYLFGLPQDMIPAD